MSEKVAVSPGTEDKKKGFFKNIVKRKRMWLLIVIVILAALAAVYLIVSLFYQKRFLPGTTINGIACGGKTVEQTEEILTQETESYELTLVERGDTAEVIAGADIGLEIDFGGELEQLLEQQSGFRWPAALSGGEELAAEQMISCDEDALQEVLDGLSCMDEDTRTDSADAVLSDYIEGTGYEIVDAVYGTRLYTSVFCEAVEEAVLNLQPELNLEEAGCYIDPEYTEDSEEMQTMLETANRYVGTTITYQFGSSSEVLDGSEISQWLVFGDDMSVSLDEEKAAEYISGLASVYNTAGQSKSLVTSYGTTVTVSGGSYGWKIDQSSTLAALSSSLEAGEDYTGEVVYSQTAASHDGQDYGSTYVEINLTAQHLWFYKNGTLVVESDLVSGSVKAGNATPTGSYQITYKQKDAVLRGQGYASPVSYWMPFNGGIGLHDASWRSTFGGTIYKTNGSHGCINLPYSAAKKIYENISAGDPVLVYTLSGTESSSASSSGSTDSTDASAANAVVDAINAIGTVTLDSADAISNARSLYDALSSENQALVTNYSTLTEAESAYAALVAAAEQAAAEQAAAEQAAQQAAQSQAQTVIDAINAIGTVTAESGSAIANARTQYDALSDTAKGYVTNYDVLTAAEAAYAALG
ncbi:MAG: L,D-transpeptidase/peptidoglycan binding protein [Lachnospiraceae bacterium]|nr:L,D-transpeptidase/peptidoglycan binding protein [Lachnospiraceae bacterium]